ncbi:hypothetical protein [Rhodococcus olei]
MEHFDVTTQSFPRSAALTRACPGERIADSAAIRSTDVDLGHSTFRTLENASTSPLSEKQAADLGRLVRRIVNSPMGLPGGFDTVEDLCRTHLAAQLAAPSAEQARAGVQRTLERLRKG